MIGDPEPCGTCCAEISLGQTAYDAALKVGASVGILSQAAKDMIKKEIKDVCQVMDQSAYRTSVGASVIVVSELMSMQHATVAYEEDRLTVYGKHGLYLLAAKVDKGDSIDIGPNSFEVFFKEGGG